MAGYGLEPVVANHHEKVTNLIHINIACSSYSFIFD